MLTIDALRRQAKAMSETSEAVVSDSVPVPLERPGLVFNGVVKSIEFDEEEECYIVRYDDGRMAICSPWIVMQMFRALPPASRARYMPVMEALDEKLALKVSCEVLRVLKYVEESTGETKSVIQSYEFETPLDARLRKRTMRVTIELE